MERYRRSRLTKEQDKLVAISGLARHMEAKLNDTYLGGLWRKILPSQFLWRVDSFTPKTMLPDYSQERARKMDDDGFAETFAIRHHNHVTTRPEARLAPTWS